MKSEPDRKSEQPVALQDLIHRAALSDTGGFVPHASEQAPLEAEVQPVPTVELLAQVDAFYLTFSQIVELLSVSDDMAMVEQRIAQFRQQIQTLRDDMWSKRAQVGRFELIEHLKQEIDQRQRAVVKIESVLEAVRLTHGE